MVQVPNLDILFLCESSTESEQLPMQSVQACISFRLHLFNVVLNIHASGPDEMLAEHSTILQCKEVVKISFCEAEERSFAL
jgi:RNA-binding protein YhbY